MSVLSAIELNYTYQSKYQKVEALKNVSCSFEDGKFYAIVGQSGSGKTTLLSMLAGLGTPDTGEVRIDGKNIRDIGYEAARRKKISVIYQAFNLLGTLSILENICYPMRINGKSAGEAKKKAVELLHTVGLGDVDPRKLPAMLSGGQQQRVAIARALGTESDFILADEPTGNLDSENGKVIISLLQSLAHEQGRCVIVVTHDMDIAKKADTVYHMADGSLWLDKQEDQAERGI